MAMREGRLREHARPARVEHLGNVQAAGRCGRECHVGLVDHPLWRDAVVDLTGEEGGVAGWCNRRQPTVVDHAIAAAAVEQRCLAWGRWCGCHRHSSAIACCWASRAVLPDEMAEGLLGLLDEGVVVDDHSEDALGGGRAGLRFVAHAVTAAAGHLARFTRRQLAQEPPAELLLHGGDDAASDARLFAPDLGRRVLRLRLFNERAEVDVALVVVGARASAQQHVVLVELQAVGSGGGALSGLAPLLLLLFCGCYRRRR